MSAKKVIFNKIILHTWRRNTDSSKWRVREFVARPALVFRSVIHGVTKSQTRLSDFTFTFHFHALEKEMATHSSVLAWRIPGTGEPGGLLSMGSHKVGHDWSDLAVAAVAVFRRNPKGSIYLGWKEMILKGNLNL